MTNENDTTPYREDLAYLTYERDKARRENWCWRIGAAVVVIVSIIAWVFL